MDALSDALVSFAVGVIKLFPTSPFVFLGRRWLARTYECLQMLNWLHSINYISFLESWRLACPPWAIYYLYQVVLRWVKLFE